MPFHSTPLFRKIKCNSTSSAPLPVLCIIHVVQLELTTHAMRKKIHCNQNEMASFYFHVKHQHLHFYTLRKSQVQMQKVYFVSQH